MSSSTMSDTRQMGGQTGGQMGQQSEGQGEDFAQFMSELGDSVQKYCKRRPGVVAGVLFGLGFFCGWKLRPW